MLSSLVTYWRPGPPRFVVERVVVASLSSEARQSTNACGRIICTAGENKESMMTGRSNIRTAHFLSLLPRNDTYPITNASFCARSSRMLRCSCGTRAQRVHSGEFGELDKAHASSVRGSHTDLMNVTPMQISWTGSHNESIDALDVLQLRLLQ
jgi:hypothetical protein